MDRKLESEYGKVIEYDGYDGMIRGINGNKYILKNTEIVGKEEIKIDDNVIFDKECINNEEIGDVLIARFVKKLKK